MKLFSLHILVALLAVSASYLEAQIGSGYEVAAMPVAPAQGVPVPTIHEMAAAKVSLIDGETSVPGVPLPVSASASTSDSEKTPCSTVDSKTVNDCYKDDGFEYIFLGGIEQADLSTE